MKHLQDLKARGNILHGDLKYISEGLSECMLIATEAILVINC